MWGQFFRDASSTLIEIFTLVKAKKLDQQISDWSSKSSLIDATGELINHLNDYGEVFEKYMKTTKLFSLRDGKM